MTGGTFALKIDSWYGFCTCILLIDSRMEPINSTVDSSIYCGPVGTFFQACATTAGGQFSLDGYTLGAAATLPSSIFNQYYGSRYKRSIQLVNPLVLVIRQLIYYRGLSAQCNQYTIDFSLSQQFINITSQTMTSILRQTGSSLVGAKPTPSQTRQLEIESVIKAEVWKRQVRMKYFFEDFDKLRKGLCIEDKFRTALSLALYFLNLNLTQEDFQSILNKYKVPPGDLIRYADFVACIDEQFGNYEFARLNLQNTKSQAFFNEAEADLLDRVLKYIKHLINVKRVLMKPAFQDFDRTKCCHITKQQFARVLNSLGFELNERFIDLIAKKYMDNGNPKEVNYVKFVNDVENIKETLEIVVRGIKPNPQKPEDMPSNVVSDPKNIPFIQTLYLNKQLPDRLLPIQDLLRRIQAEVVAKRVRIREFFLDFDGLRKNIVTGQQFKRIISMLNLTLAPEEYEALLNEYRVEPNDNRIKWMNFCDDIDLVWTTKGIDKDPLYKVPPYDVALTLPARRLYLDLNQSQESKLNDLLEKYKREIASKRILLKPHFEDFDITKIGYITKNQFLRILDQFGVLPKSPEDVNLLLKKYVDNGNLNEVNYYEFVKDVDFYNEDGKHISKTHANSFVHYNKPQPTQKAYISNAMPDDLSDLLNRIRKRVKEERIRVSEFLRDFDKLRSGTITKDQLRLGLTMAKIVLSDAEYKLILDYFSCPDKVGYVKAREFCDTIDEVFTRKNLEKDQPQQPLIPANTEFSYGKEQVTPQQAALAEQVKKRFTQFSRNNRLDIKQFFQDWDKLGRYKVSPKQFRQVLATAYFLLSEEEFRVICKVYASEDRKEVRYIDFLADTRPFNFDYMTQTKQQWKRGTGSPKKIPQGIRQIVDDLRTLTKVNRLRYKEYFQDFDPLRKGNVKRNKFRSVVHQTMKLGLDDRVLDRLEAYYRNSEDPTLVDYMRFLDDIDIVFTLPERQKDPLQTPPVFDYSQTHVPNVPLANSADELEKLLRRLGEVARKHRLLLKPHFQDNDVAKSGKVSFTRMRAILDYNKLPLTDRQFELLCKRFSHEGIEFNYVQFDEVLKKYEALQ